MTDDRVDALLEELDRELAMLPSPALAATVRRRIAREGARGWLGVRGLIAVTAATVLVCAITYLAWPRLVLPAPGVQSPPPVEAGSTADYSAVARVDPSPVTDSAARAHRASQVVRSDIRRPAQAEAAQEVIVSPSQRLALNQLLAAVSAGRIDPVSLSANDDTTDEADPFILKILVIDRVKADVVQSPRPANDQGGIR